MITVFTSTLISSSILEIIVRSTVDAFHGILDFELLRASWKIVRLSSCKVLRLLGLKKIANTWIYKNFKPCICNFLGLLKSARGKLKNIPCTDARCRVSPSSLPLLKDFYSRPYLLFVKQHRSFLSIPYSLFPNP